MKGMRAQRDLGKESSTKHKGQGMPVGATDANQGECRVPHTCTASATPLEELEEDIGGNSPSQGTPRGLHSQQVHYGKKGSCGHPGFASGKTAPGCPFLTTQLPLSPSLGKGHLSYQAKEEPAG